MGVHRSSASFNRALDRFLKTLPDEVVLPATKRIAMDVLRRVVLKSPVGNPSLWKNPRPGYVGGRFRGNWQVSVNTRDETATEETDPSGNATIARGTAEIGAIITLPEAIYIQNNVAYAGRIESGWSGQAPQGVVALTLAEVEAGLTRR